jgi:transmembrane sensor
MYGMSGRQSASEIEAEAARWVMRLDREGRTCDVADDLQNWLAGDTRRQGALLQAEAAWVMLDRGQLLSAEPGRRAANDSLRVPRRALFVGAGAAIAAGVGAAFLLNLPEQYGTAVGEVRRIPLADGSTAAINTGSTINVDLGRDARRVRLEKGEAWFQVARDPSRPFRVEAGPVRVEAVGTAFSVRRRKGGADVRVTEGVVRVWVEGAEGHVVRLSAGAKAFVADNAAVTERTGAPSEIDRELAWRSGKIDLAGETLEQAVAEFNRYNARKLVVTDPDLAAERLYGVFRTDDPEGFAGAAAASLDASVSADADEIRIGARS